jgi:hypothetical protein
LPSGTGRARAGLVDLKNADVVEEIGTDDLRGHPVAVRELDVHSPARVVLPEEPCPAVVITCAFVG